MKYYLAVRLRSAQQNQNSNMKRFSTQVVYSFRERHTFYSHHRQKNVSYNLANLFPHFQATYYNSVSRTTLHSLNHFVCTQSKWIICSPGLPDLRVIQYLIIVISQAQALVLVLLVLHTFHVTLNNVFKLCKSQLFHIQNWVNNTCITLQL